MITGIQPGADGRIDQAPHREGVITQAEFMEKLSAERAGYQAMLGKME